AHRVRKHSSMFPAPYSCETRESEPINSPSQTMAKTMKMAEPRLTAANEVAPAWPIMAMSTKLIAIQPTSPITMGTARRSREGISRRISVAETMKPSQWMTPVGGRHGRKLALGDLARAQTAGADAHALGVGRASNLGFHRMQIHIPAAAGLV